MITGSLKALLANLIDYAGLYPPASLPLPQVIDNYRRYLGSEDAWMLNRLVLPVEKFGSVDPGENWRMSLLVDEDPGPLPPQVETLETKGVRQLCLPAYREAPLEDVKDGFAKIRTGGLTADSVPSAESLAAFLCAAAARGVPFKATAGLHCPIRSTMHGFLNVFLAATFAWRGMGCAAAAQLLNETDPRAFQFREDEAQWRGWRASTAEIQEARRDFAHSFGSCSFEEPVHELRALGFLS